MSEKGRDHPFVSTELCASRHNGLNKQFETMSSELRTIKKALVGEDLQGGLVAEIQGIKAQLKLGRELKDWVKPVVIAVVSALITAAAFKIFGI